MNLLVEKGYCKAATFKWKDSKGGNKKLLVSIIKKLFLLNYYQETQLTSNEIKKIALSTFGVSISLSTVKHTSDVHPSISFIPLSKS